MSVHFLACQPSTLPSVMTWGHTNSPTGYQQNLAELDMNKAHLVLMCVSNAVDIIITSYQTHAAGRATTVAAARGATAVGARAGRHVGREKKWKVLIRILWSGVRKMSTIEKTTRLIHLYTISTVRHVNGHLLWYYPPAILIRQFYPSR